MTVEADPVFSRAFPRGAIRRRRRAHGVAGLAFSRPARRVQSSGDRTDFSGQPGECDPHVYSPPSTEDPIGCEMDFECNWGRR